MAGTVDQACGKIVILVTRAQCFTQSSSAVPQKVMGSELHIPGRKLSPPPAPGAARAALFFPGSCTLGLRVSLPSAVDVLFLALRMAHRLPPSKHPSTVASPDPTGYTAPGLPALPSTLHIPFTHFIASMALSTSQHSAFICVSAYGPSPSDYEGRGPAGMLSCWAPSTRSRNRHSAWLSESTSVALPGGRGRLSTSTVRFQSLPAQTIPLFHSQAGQVSDLRFSSQTHQVGMMSSILRMRTMGFLGDTLKAMWRKAGIHLHG